MLLLPHPATSLTPQAKLSTLHPGLFPAFKLASAHGPPVSIPPAVAAAAAAEEPSAATASHPDSSNSPHPSRPAAPSQPTSSMPAAAADAPTAVVAPDATTSAQETERPAEGAANGSSLPEASKTPTTSAATTTTQPPTTTITKSAAANTKSNTHSTATTIPLHLSPEAVQALLCPATSLLRYHLMPQPKQGPDSGDAGGRVCSAQVAEAFRTDWSEEMARLAQVLEAEAEEERQAGKCRFSR